MNDTLLLRRTAALITVLAISGCGGSGSGNPNPPSTLPPITTPPTTLVVTSLCTAPTPPPLFGMRVKLQLDNGFRKQLDSWPIVPDVDGYCRKVGLDGFRCETRGHDDPQRPACDALVVGRAGDTGRFGPTWSVDGKVCNPAVNPGDPGCSNHPDNQFLVIARGNGEFLACASDSVPLAEGGSRCGGLEIR
jgi:hypothetical protein